MNNLIIALALTAVCSGCGVAIVQPALDPDGLRAARHVMEAGAQSLRVANYDQAAEYFELAFQLGRRAPALDGLGCIAAKRGESKLALQRFNEALEIDPNLTEVYGHGALVYEAVGDLNAAEEMFKRGIGIRPGDIALRYDFARYLQRHQRFVDSKIMISQVKAMLPKFLSPIS